LSQVIDIFVDDEGSSNNVCNAGLKRDERVLNTDTSYSIRTSLNVSKVTDVPFVMLRTSMFLSMRIEVRTGRCASIGSITKFVNMESVKTGFQSSNFTINRDWTISLLFKGNRSLDSRTL